MSNPANYNRNNLFTKFGVEFECVIVDKENLDIKPIADQLLHQIAKAYVNEVEFKKTAWSNELAMHQIEIKNKDPIPDLDNLAQIFQQDITRINAILADFNAQLLPTGAHPWMNPCTETKIWPHDYNEIYNAYHKIFNCHNHGWANLQSIHLNLPFADGAEFAKLHTAIRLILPLIPALCASTPILNGNVNGIADNRLYVYANNQNKIPSIAGQIIPEAILSPAEYQTKILAKIYEDIAPYDPKRILQDEWLNSRGAIARFDRNTIEIRVADTQECTLTSIALLYFITAMLKASVDGLWLDFEEQYNFDTLDLAKIFHATVKHGSNTEINDQHYLEAFGHTCNQPANAKELLSHIYKKLLANNYLINTDFNNVITLILQHGNLSERIVKALNNDYSLVNIKKIYRQLSECLNHGKFFIAQM
jgi:glutamate---cysteine ligase / carboxylate-amine ligase